MLSIIWLGLMLTALVFGIVDHRLSQVVEAISRSAQLAVTIAIQLAGIMMLWLGLLKIAEDAGMVHKLASWMRPLLRRLFPDVPDDHPAMGAMVMNIAANMMGLGNAATPLGLRAMQYLSDLTEKSPVASNAMVMFLALNTSSVQLIPATAIAYLAANGNHQAAAIILPTVLATTCSTIAGIGMAKLLQRRFR